MLPSVWSHFLEDLSAASLEVCFEPLDFLFPFTLVTRFIPMLSSIQMQLRKKRQNGGSNAIAISAMLDMTCLLLQDNQVKTSETVRLQIQLHFDTRHFSWSPKCLDERLVELRNHHSKGFPFILGKHKKPWRHIFYTLENEHFEPKNHGNWKGKSSEPNLRVFGFHINEVFFSLKPSCLKKKHPWMSHGVVRLPGFKAAGAPEASGGTVFFFPT